MNGTANLQQLRAVEALRSGVPNRDAVKWLGTTQPEIDTKFQERIEAAARGEAAGGLIIAGDFGSGKSHLLQYLGQRALDRNFVVSRIVISKETPLHDVAKVLRSAVETAVVPDRRGLAIDAITESLRFETPEFEAFYDWSGNPRSGINDRFPATLFMFQHLRHQDEDLTDKVLRFWSGDTIAVGEVKRALKELGEQGTWTIGRQPPARELAVQRFRFLARMIRAAGYAGWTLLFDEVELIGRYSLLQRGRSYAEVARWVRGFETEPLHGIATVLAFTQDFTSAVLDAKNDRDGVPNRLRARGTPEDDLSAVRAEQGMRLIDSNALLRLEPQTEQKIAQTCARLRQLHGEAYGWDPPELDAKRRETSTPMRQYVRRWIHEWDLRRLDPAYTPDIEIEEIAPDYSESEELESPESGWENAGEE